MSKPRWIILRPEYRDRLNELETPEETAERRGVRLTNVRSFSARYPGEYPEVVARQGRTSFRDPKEVDAFFDWLENRPRTRTPAEKNASEVVGLKRSLAAAQQQLAERAALHEEAQRNVARLENMLRAKEEMVELLTPPGQAQ